MCFTPQFLHQFPHQTSLGTNTATSPSTPTETTTPVEGQKEQVRCAGCNGRCTTSRLHGQMHAMPTHSSHDRSKEATAPHQSTGGGSSLLGENTFFGRHPDIRATAANKQRALTLTQKAHNRPDARDTLDTRRNTDTKKNRRLAHHKLSPKNLFYYTSKTNA